MWRNWAGDQHCEPAAVEHPASEAEVVEAVGRAAEAGQTVKVTASGHSFTDIACTGGRMLRIEAMDRLLEVDRESGLARVEAGIALDRLSEGLWERGLALENMGDIAVQTLAGAISTGTHGTGAAFANISAQIEAMRMVLADGSVLECSRESDPETLRAARVGLGALGVITEITLRCVPAFTINRLDEPRPLGETLERFQEHADANDHFEFYVFPHTEVALCRFSRRSGEEPRPKPRWKEYVGEVLVENRAMDLLARFGRRFPSQIPRLARLGARTMGSSRKLDRSYRVYGSRRLIRFTEMEYAVPREHGPEAVRRVLDAIPEHGFDVSFPIEVRVVAGDDAYLSPAHQRATCYIAVHMYRGMEWEPYFRRVEEIMGSYGGRPHWGKRHFQTAAELGPRYPEWESFQAVRARLDPDARFANEYLERVLEPVGVRAPS